MLVSAISASHNQISRPINYGYINARGGEGGTESTVNNFITNHRLTNKPEDDAEVYNSVNEWKSFCHKQIAGGKLNIIA